MWECGSASQSHSIDKSQIETMQTGLLQGHERRQPGHGTMSACHQMDRMRTWGHEQGKRRASANAEWMYCSAESAVCLSRAIN